MNRENASPSPGHDFGGQHFALDALPHLAWIAGPDGALTYLSRRCIEFIGVPQDDLLGWDWGWVVHPADLPRTLAIWNRAVRDGTDYVSEHRLRRADGEYRWHIIRASPLKNADGEVIRWYGTGTDVDDARRAEAGLRNTQSLFRALVERNEDGAAVVGPDGVIRYVSPAVIRILGHQPDVIQGLNGCELAHPDEQSQLSRCLAELLIHPGERFESVHRFRHKDGGFRPLSVHATNLLPDPDVRAITVGFREAKL